MIPRDAPPLQQSPAYGQAMAALGARAHAVGAVHLIERPGLRLIQRATLTLPEARRLARFPGATILTAPLHGPGLLPLVTARHHAEWDLSPPPEALRAGLHGKWRNALRRGEALHLGQDDPRALADLLAREAEQARHRRYRSLPAGFVAHWPGPRLLLHLRHKGGLEAAMLFLIHGGAATYHIGWTSAAGRARQAHRAMLWQAALHLRAAGVRRLDLGPVDSTNPGLARFKLGTGARLTDLGPTSLVLPG
ncbi:MAG: GNAT family N-acetyltransferase [Gemmobacter sp.]|uniref:GNAT family N-acetyltransferase n=1 Tax=Gemmobacter sp. TaxID=1898957 RepID=UPI001A49715F|nr:GNAT family N-acetyltransferase [Gemmobacter sp.]MBL8561019.1 GNAT family N-acetyltransferase [Gemmobacter sp.]